MRVRRHSAGRCLAGLLLAGVVAVAPVGVAHAMTRAGQSRGMTLRPSIDGDRMVYARWKDGVYSVWLKDLATGTTRPLSDPAVNAYDPDIQGDTVVWEECTPSGGDIVVYSLAETRAMRLTTEADDCCPAVWENTVVWRRETSGVADLYAASLTSLTIRLIVKSVDPESQPEIFESTVVYARNGDIWALDLASGTNRMLVSAEGAQDSPSLSGSLLAYTDWSGHLGQVRVRNIDTGADIAVRDSVLCQYAPAIDGERIAFESYEIRCEPKIVVEMLDRRRLGAAAPTAAQRTAARIPMSPRIAGSTSIALPPSLASARRDPTILPLVLALPLTRRRRAR